MKRVLTAAILAPIVVWLVLWAPGAAFLAVLATVAVLCFREYEGIIAAYGIVRPGLAAYAAGVILMFLPSDATLFLVLLALLFLAAGIAAADLSQGLPRAGAAVLGVLYIFGAWRFAIPLRAVDPNWLMFALAASWVGDTAAYYVGKNFGKHRMAPVVSPGKTWEGAAASLAGSVIFGVLYVGNLIPGVGAAAGAGIALAANAAGQFGDLAESAFKRGAGVKDSGTMLPGHGGWLDRVDSSLFAIPVVYFAVRYLM
ncbi:MAG: phosphatidate cytidylyltransferase [bacterium]|jgi:phosphatidate cytidylyltransferase